MWAGLIIGIVGESKREKLHILGVCCWVISVGSIGKVGRGPGNNHTHAHAICTYLTLPYISVPPLQ